MLGFINNNAEKIYKLIKIIYLIISIESFLIVGLLIIFYDSKSIHVLLTFLTLGLGLFFNNLYFNNITKNAEVNAVLIAKYFCISIMILFDSFLFVEIGEHNYTSVIYIYIVTLFLSLCYILLNRLK